MNTTTLVGKIENRAAIDATLSRIRDALGPARHADLDRQGREMTFEAAVQSVRGWLSGAGSGSQV